MRSILALGIAGLAAVSLAGACGGSGSGGFNGNSEGDGGSSGSNQSSSSGSFSSSGSNSGSSGSSGSQGSSGGNSSGGNGSGGSNSSSGSGSGSSSGSSSSGSSTGSSGGSGAGPSPTMLPSVSGMCPTIPQNANGTSLTFAGEPVDVWTGSGTGGPLVMFWYETGGSATDVSFQFGTAQISAVTAEGGMVASFAKSNGMGTDTGDAVWFTGDFTTADQVVACAIQQLKINTRRIFTTGASAGALQAVYMAFARSGYIASVAPISGGVIVPPAYQDPSNVPSAMVIHGAPGLDVVIIDFASASATYESDIAMSHGFSMDCNTGGGHVGGPPAICPGIWQFFEDHPFKVSPQPYPPIPAVFPSYCQIGPRAADGGAP
jgi:hypothetical protein